MIPTKAYSSEADVGVCVCVCVCVCVWVCVQLGLLFYCFLGNCFLGNNSTHTDDP